MNATKRKKLEAAGWKVGTVQEFLHLSDAEMALIDLKLRLVTPLNAPHKSQRITHRNLASRMSTTPSRITALQGSCVDASLDQILLALLSLGIPLPQLAQIIAASD